MNCLKFHNQGVAASAVLIRVSSMDEAAADESLTVTDGEARLVWFSSLIIFWVCTCFYTYVCVYRVNLLSMCAISEAESFVFVIIFNLSSSNFSVCLISLYHRKSK